MTANPSVAFEGILKTLEARRQANTDLRRNYTKNIVSQSNDEARSGMPYVVDVAAVIGQANATEIFLDGLVIGLRSDSRTLSEGTSLKRAIARVFDQLKSMDPNDLTKSTPPRELAEIGKYLLDSAGPLELRTD